MRLKYSYIHRLGGARPRRDWCEEVGLLRGAGTSQALSRTIQLVSETTATKVLSLARLARKHTMLSRLL